MTKTLACLCASALLLSSCAKPAPAPAALAPDQPQAWLLPSPLNAAQPDLFLTSDGRILLSRMSTVPGRRNALQFSEYDAHGRWDGPRTIAVGNSLFVNWADTPHITATPDGALWVHWLQKSADAPYAYNIMLARSRDGGMNWSDPVQVHEDRTQTEHGFVSLWPQTRDMLGVAWLDGRNTAGGDTHEGHTAHDEHAGAMTLRASVFDGELQRTHVAELDTMTCDCCQTDVAMTDKGALLVYRDRSKDDIRDIAATRFDGERWTSAKPVHIDNWKMPACPVNGPAVAARGNIAVTAWYTAAGDLPTLKLARSENAGDTFGAPVVVDQGAAVQGRVDLAFDGKQAWVLWLRETNGAQSLWLARYAADLSRELKRIEVAKLQGTGRGTGFPKLVVRDGIAHIVWTDVVDGRPQLRGARVAQPPAT